MCTCTVKGKKDVDARRKTLEVLRLIRVYQKPELWNDVSSLILDHRELDVHNVLTPDNIEDLIYVITNDVASGDITKLKFVTFWIYMHVRPDHWTHSFMHHYCLKQNLH